jgi:hypothetical protein
MSALTHTETAFDQRRRVPDIVGIFVLEESKKKRLVVGEAAKRHVVPESGHVEKGGCKFRGGCVHVLRSVTFVKTAVRPSRGDKFQDCEGISKFAGQVATARESRVGRRRRRGSRCIER